MSDASGEDVGKDRESVGVAGADDVWVGLVDESVAEGVLETDRCK